MRTAEIKKEIVKIIRELLESVWFEFGFSDDVNLINDLGMDSLTFIAIVVSLEERFEIIIPDDLLLMENFQKIDDIVNVVEQMGSNL